MRNQTAMFTSEQMTGSGQTNMLDMINYNESRVRHLRCAPHNFFSDPGHGWLEVSFQDLIILGILGSISGCSYRDGDKVYLEEDVDAGIYMKALFPLLREDSAYVKWTHLIEYSERECIFIRHLKHF